MIKLWPCTFPLPMDCIICTWAKAALEAGKHVLVEKPIACNEDQVRDLASCAEKNGKLIMEAIHTFHHPALLRAREIIRSGEIGSICEITCTMKSSISYNDIRFNNAGSNPTLGGGAMMDNGVYCIHALQFLTDSYINRVIEAHAKERFEGVVSKMDVVVDFGTFLGRIYCSMDESWPFNFLPTCTVHGSHGTLVMYNFILPHIWHRLTIHGNNNTSRVESCYGMAAAAGQTSWQYQLQEFVHGIEMKQVGICKTSTWFMLDAYIHIIKPNNLPF
jgi:predicted dehydrogenase